MLHKQLIQNITEQTGMKKSKAEDMMAATVNTILDAMREGQDVQLQGLGTMEVREKNERIVVNPKTQERTTVPAGKKISFRPVAAIKEELK